VTDSDHYREVIADGSVFRVHETQAFPGDRMFSACDRCHCRHAGCHGYGPPCQCPPEPLLPEGRAGLVGHLR